MKSQGNQPLGAPIDIIGESKEKSNNNDNNDAIENLKNDSQKSEENSENNENNSSGESNEIDKNNISNIGENGSNSDCKNNFDAMEIGTDDEMLGIGNVNSNDNKENSIVTRALQQDQNKTYLAFSIINILNKSTTVAFSLTCFKIYQLCINFI